MDVRTYTWLSGYTPGVDKPSNKAKLLAEGLKLMHRNGYTATSTRDVTSAAGVAHGAFTQQFASKEDFGLAVLDLYTQYSDKLVAETLGNEKITPLARVRAYIAGHVAMMKRDGNRSGCMYGNFAAELPELSDEISKQVAQRLAEREQSVAECLQSAVMTGELPKSFDVESTATFTIAALQGAMLISKVRHHGGPMEALKTVLFEQLLVK
jgi:TetR/AcrR family transcriptional repressor of nem operon